MKLISAIKNFRWGYLFVSIILCAVGVCFAIFPIESLRTVSYVIAGAALVFGIVQIIALLANRQRGVPFAFAVVFASLTVICGAVGLAIPDQVAKVYPMFIGLLIIIDGSFKLQTVISAKRYKLKMWWFLLIISVLTIVGGFLVVRTQLTDESQRFFTLLMGISLFLCGLENFFSLFYLGRIVKSAVREYEAHAKVISSGEDAVQADSYLNTSPDRIKEEIIPLDKESKAVSIPSADFIITEHEKPKEAEMEPTDSKND